jgi:hypothetical protein
MEEQILNYPKEGRLGLGFTWMGQEAERAWAVNRMRER